MSYKFHNEQDCDWDNDIDFDCNYDYDYVTDSDYYYVCRHKCDFDCNLILIVKVTILPWLTLCLWLKIEFLLCLCLRCDKEFDFISFWDFSCICDSELIFGKYLKVVIIGMKVLMSVMMTVIFIVILNVSLVWKSVCIWELANLFYIWVSSH